MDLQQYKLERHKRFLTANLLEEEAKFKAKLASMTPEGKKKRLNYMVGWPLETPHSRELYNNPKDFRVVRRLRAIEMIRMVFGYHLTQCLKKEMESRLQTRLRGSYMRDVRLICVGRQSQEAAPGTGGGMEDEDQVVPSRCGYTGHQGSPRRHPKSFQT
ncbi:hypothetical protein FOIG_10850 [Fusarium odoratissimum NRRL 54006]|uniref:Uncharacterized protein n=2 Tax=Fusarium oxysporum species complex TaxID=171631 RepID=X0J7J2_FUSO5|nr:uncharacterized protein FOIG_10850 [Fusarium odoratissimum NRRL 54006]XP_031059278.1 uncharacterized protein FOIG_10850 [Fusarium odoratissimum NRRL 54006]EXL97187.1 hypothetical protein FOIG_10850 [Fusarium odoratissimum NRRL 54006]EXL97188.1 hypothetical protein FOIG_10850 [Fusarium odoratissimum NRRL 54006]TXC00897.1 hypothetical protein FocTR4_00009075 [Fusarium oxysporum f. sp. cubense]